MLLKKRYVRFNHKLSLIMKFLSQSWREVGKEIVFYKTVVKKIRNYFANKRNKYVPLLQKSKKDYFANLNEKNITDNKHFWKNLNIPNYENCDSLAENIDDSTLETIVKWRNHPI